MTMPRFSMNGDGKSQPSQDDKSDVVRTLQVKFDELNELWVKAEKQLKRIPIPVNASIEYKSVAVTDDPNYDNGDRIHSLLGFVKWGGQWRLCYGEYHDGYPDMDTSWKPIADCSADIRIETIRHLNKLREAVLAKAADCVETLDKSIDDLTSTLAGWKK